MAKARIPSEGLFARRAGFDFLSYGSLDLLKLLRCPDELVCMLQGNDDDTINVARSPEFATTATPSIPGIATGPSRSINSQRRPAFVGEWRQKNVGNWNSCNSIASRMAPLTGGACRLM